MPAPNTWNWLKEQDEGQFLERKSCYDRSSRLSRPRPVKEVLWDLAEALVAMGNADGSTVAVGPEDDGTVMGVPSRYQFRQTQWRLSDDVCLRLNFCVHEISLEEQRVWVSETDWSPKVQQLLDAILYLERGTKLSFPARDIDAMKVSEDFPLVGSERMVGTRRRKAGQALCPR
ncbi:MAG: putative DNA binding domain-containing protein [Candidatus Caldatribacterium sp.]|nr:putative DNA binding domain-containing protein [Candidatus Caldatribacterium sp.]